MLSSKEQTTDKLHRVQVCKSCGQGHFVAIHSSSTVHKIVLEVKYTFFRLSGSDMARLLIICNSVVRGIRLSRENPQIWQEHTFILYRPYG